MSWGTLRDHGLEGYQSHLVMAPAPAVGECLEGGREGGREVRKYSVIRTFDTYTASRDHHMTY